MAKPKKPAKKPPKQPRTPAPPRAYQSAHNRGADETLIAARRQRVAAAYLCGKTQWHIADAEGCDQGTISRDLKELRELWLSNAVRDFGERQAEELAKVDRLESEAWDAWGRSKRPCETRTAEKTTYDDTTRRKAVKRVEGRDGNPAFLATVERCIERRCAILGLDAPKRHEVSVINPLRVATDEQLRTLDTVLGQIADAAAGAGGSSG